MTSPMACWPRICAVFGTQLLAILLHRNINTPLELAIENEIDRFTLAIDVIDRVPKLQTIGAHAKEKLRNLQINCRRYAHEHGVDMPEINEWRWPY